MLVRGSSEARPAASRRSGATPASAKARTTDAARPADSSQLDGNAAVWMGTGSVNPRTRMTCWFSARSSGADLRQQATPAGLHGGRAAAEEQLVGQQADDQAVGGDDRRHLAGQAVLVDVGVDARLERLEVLLLGLGGRGGGLGARPCAGAVAGDGRLVVGGVAATFGDFVSPPLSCSARPPGRMRPEKASCSERCRVTYLVLFTEEIENRTMNSAISSVIMSA